MLSTRECEISSLYYFRLKITGLQVYSVNKWMFYYQLKDRNIGSFMTTSHSSVKMEGLMGHTCGKLYPPSNPQGVKRDNWGPVLHCRNELDS